MIYLFHTLCWRGYWGYMDMCWTQTVSYSMRNLLLCLRGLACCSCTAITWSQSHTTIQNFCCLWIAACLVVCMAVRLIAETKLLCVLQVLLLPVSFIPMLQFDSIASHSWADVHATMLRHSFEIYGKWSNKKASKHTHARTQCSHTSVGLVPINLLHSLLGQAWASPTLAWMHCARVCVCLFVCLFGPTTYRKF